MISFLSTAFFHHHSIRPNPRSNHHLEVSASHPTQVLIMHIPIYLFIATVSAAAWRQNPPPSPPTPEHICTRLQYCTNETDMCMRNPKGSDTACGPTCDQYGLCVSTSEENKCGMNVTVNGDFEERRYCKEGKICVGTTPFNPVCDVDGVEGECEGLCVLGFEEENGGW